MRSHGTPSFDPTSSGKAVAISSYELGILRSRVRWIHMNNVDTFLVLNLDLEHFLKKYFFDTTSLIIDYLQEIGIKKENIFDSGICSVCNKELMHSYRAEKQDASRNIAIIEL